MISVITYTLQRHQYVTDDFERGHLMLDPKEEDRDNPTKVE
jgi:hypothetical protein